MISFGVQAPDFEKTRQLLAHIPGAAEKAIGRAINKAINSAKTEALRHVAERYAIDASNLKKSIKIIGASAKRLRALLIAASPPYPVTKFKFKRKGRGVATTEIVNSESKPWVSAFLATVKGPYGGNHLGVFTREKDGAYREPSSRGAGGGFYKGRMSSRNGSRTDKGHQILRQQIHERFSVSSAQMVGHHEVIQAVLHLAGSKLSGELDRQIELFLNGKVS